MITKNFKMVVSCILQSAGYVNTNGYIPVKDLAGTTRYIGCCFDQFPYNITSNVTFNGASTGIRVGSGNIEATGNDYKMDSMITSGLTSSNPTMTYGEDSGNPYLEYLFTLTNTTGADIVVNEIGYVQSVRTATSSGGSATIVTPILLDRTVLSTPVTVPANSSAAIKYRLKTVIS
jgi:hypothetical protein